MPVKRRAISSPCDAAGQARAAPARLRHRLCLRHARLWPGASGLLAAAPLKRRRSALVRVVQDIHDLADAVAAVDGERQAEAFEMHKAAVEEIGRAHV